MLVHDALTYSSNSQFNQERLIPNSTIILITTVTKWNYARSFAIGLYPEPGYTRGGDAEFWFARIPPGGQTLVVVVVKKGVAAPCCWISVWLPAAWWWLGWRRVAFKVWQQRSDWLRDNVSHPIGRLKWNPAHISRWRNHREIDTLCITRLLKRFFLPELPLKPHMGSTLARVGRCYTVIGSSAFEGRDLAYGVSAKEQIQKWKGIHALRRKKHPMAS